MGTKYRDFQLTLQPSWLRDPAGMDFIHAGKGDVKDALVERIKDAVFARFPLRAPTDALQKIGEERQIPRGQNETDAAYAVRLQHAWDIWPYAGTALGVLNALWYAGYRNVVLLPYLKNYFTLDASGSLVVGSLNGAGWREDFSTFWSRFTVLFPYPLPAAWLQPVTDTAPAVLRSTGATGTVTVGLQSPAADYRAVIVITTAGATGTAVFKYSLDNGVTWTLNQLTSGSFSIGGGTGVSISFSGTFSLGATFTFAPTFSPPTDGSAEAIRIKALVNAWKPATATVSRYIIHTSGSIRGYPASQVRGAPGLMWGGASATYWTP